MADSLRSHTRIPDYMRQRLMAAAEARSRGCLCSVVVNALEYKLNEKTRRKRRNAETPGGRIFESVYKSSHFMNNRQPNRKIIECGLDLTCKFKLNLTCNLEAPSRQNLPVVSGTSVVR